LTRGPSGVSPRLRIFRDALDELAGLLRGRLDGDVGLAHDLDELLVRVEYQYAADLVLLHCLERRLDRIIGTHRHGRALAKLAGLGLDRVTKKRK
jgi:hypothetical protein